MIVADQEALEDDSDENDEDCVRIKVAQDLVYCVSAGGKWTPKHVRIANCEYTTPS